MSLALPQLHRRFFSQEDYVTREGEYRLLPTRFALLEDGRYVATNFVGQFVTLTSNDLRAFLNKRLSRDGQIYRLLRSRHFLMEDGDDVALDLLATKYRTKHSSLADFTGLHMFVVTLRCDHSCPYCQVSRVSSDRAAFDMSPDTAAKAVDLLFQSPNPRLKVEFQGGEPLLNFGLVRTIVEAVEARNIGERRDVAFVIATNLAQLTDEMLLYCRAHGIHISTSLDGPRELHNRNRPRPGRDSYERAVDGIRRCRSALGPHAVSALMTTTAASLEQPEAIVDEYVRQGFSSVFLRWLSPYGFAAKSEKAIGYSVENWNRFYERGVQYILSLNRAGLPFVEQYASIILRKMVTAYGTGYVDLQSPTGLGISAVVYNYDGDVYASDESRMLAESGDKTFRLGNVHTDTYADIFLSERLSEIVSSTMTDSTPECADCAFEPFCGTDPVFHHATQGDMIGHRPTSAFCSRNMFVFKLLIELLEGNADIRALLTRWGNL